MNKYGPNITRIDDERTKTHGFQVRFQRWEKKEKRTPGSKFFADKKYGGRRAAHGAAVTWRDENRLLHPKASPPGKKTGRKPEPVGYENVIEFERTFRRADGSSYRLPTLLAKIKVTRTRFERKQISIGQRSRASVQREIDAWLSEQRRKLAARAA
jgi:hypothetical protein